MKAFFLSKKIIAAIAIILLIAGYFIFKDGNGKQIVAVVRTDIAQEVAATGKAKPNQSVDLGFDKSGRVGSVRASVGDRVLKGQVIASLEAGEAAADLAKARAQLEEEKSKLRELQSTAPVSFGDASKNLDTAIREGFADADNAIRNRTDQFFKNLPDNPRFEISITSGNFIHYFAIPTDLSIELNTGRKAVESILNNWEKRLSELSPSNIAGEADKSISDLRSISAFLDRMASAVNTFDSADFAYDTTVSGYKTAIASARSETTAAASAIVTAKDKLTSAPTLGESGEFESILAQEAKVAQAAANVSSYEAMLGKSFIIAPFEGTVTVQDAKVGAAVSAAETVVSMMSRENMYIEANISEINVGKVAVGNPVSVTFDAFPSEEFSGEVSYMEPGETIVDGVVNYKIRVSLNTLDQRIKSGLTANLIVKTAEKNGVLAVPLYAVIRESDEKGNESYFANKLIDGETQKVPVTLGISGSDGTVEIKSGLEEGDLVQY